MMKNPILDEQARKLMAQIDLTKVGDSILNKYNESTQEEKDQFNQIKRKINQYNEAKDNEGLKKYLMHIRTKL